LRRHGVPAIAVRFDDNLVGFSRAQQQTLVVGAAPLAEKLTRLRDLLLAIPAAERPVLMPTSDIVLDFICDHRAELEARFHLLLSESQVIRALNDKAEETAWVGKLGFALPRTVAPLPSSADELLDRLPLPIMVKLRKHAYWSVLGNKSVILHTRQEVERLYVEKDEQTRFLIGQELIEAPDDASWLCNAVFDRTHRLASACLKRKIRMMPTHYGPATIAISASNRNVLDLAEQMGSRMRLTGIASFEFRQDPRDGAYRYIENNPRLAGGSSGADYDFQIGIPTAWIAYRLALGLPLTDKGRQKDGVVYCDWLQDLQTRVRAGESAAAVLRHHAALSWRHTVCRPCASWSDPLPGIVAFSRWVGKRFGRRA
jgi:predicted ATP-grasp superfamily ATP-dependent carboligase